MLQIILVVFREIFEIALILGILFAVTKNISGRTKWIVSGLFIGLIGSLILAFLTDKISEIFDGAGQEIFNGTILTTAAIMISWTILWMQKHAKLISSELKDLSYKIEHKKLPLYNLAFVALFSSLREGAEIVLFTYSSYISGVTEQTIIIAIFIGIALGVIFGAAMYFGMLKIFGRYFFTVTTYILVFLVSGILAQACGFFINADILPALENPMWDSSIILSQTSIVGKFFHAFFGYIERPSAMQVLVYVLSLLILFISLRIIKAPIHVRK